MEDNYLTIEQAGKEAQVIIEESNNNNLKNSTYFWNLKKKILKEKYNIDWLTPKESNRDTIYD